MAAITGKFIRRKKLALIYISHIATHHDKTTCSSCYHDCHCWMLYFFFHFKKVVTFILLSVGGGQSFSALSDNPVSWTVSLSPGWQSVSCPAGSLSLISILTLHLFTDLAVLPAYCCIVDNFCGWVRVSSLSDLRWPLCHSLQRLPSWPSFSRTSLGSEALMEVDCPSLESHVL